MVSKARNISASIKFLESIDKSEREKIFVLDKFLCETEFMALVDDQNSEDDLLYGDFFDAGFRHVGDFIALNIDQINDRLERAAEETGTEKSKLHGLAQKICSYLDERYQIVCGQYDLSTWKRYRKSCEDGFRFPWSLPPNIEHLSKNLNLDIVSKR